MVKGACRCGVDKSEGDGEEKGQPLEQPDPVGDRTNEKDSKAQDETHEKDEPTKGK